MFKELTLRNFLSFGPNAEPVALGPLNVLVGANGSGKSNFIEAVALLHEAPEQGRFQEYLWAGGGVEAWIHKSASGEASRSFEIESVVSLDTQKAQKAQRQKVVTPDLRHRLRVAHVERRVEILDERVESAVPERGKKKRALYFGYEGGVARIDRGGDKAEMARAELEPDASILSQVRDPRGLPELSRLALAYRADIRLFREWTIGRNAPCRQSQLPETTQDFLTVDARNLAPVLMSFQMFPAVQRRIHALLADLAPGFEKYVVDLSGGRVQLFLAERGDRLVSAQRLSDGTLRFLALLTILLHPLPPAVVVLEEPEIGLHPDLLPTVAKLLMEASERTQLIVTTHSDILVDALTPMPESLLFCDKVEGETIIRRATPAEIAASCGPHAESPSRLGHAWLSGEFGGRRW